MNTIERRVVVDLTLLNVSQDVIEDDEKGTKLVEHVRSHLFTDAIDADSLLSGKLSCPEEVQRIQQHILRYVKVKDKYAALTSTLLKSRAFHFALEDILQPKQDDDDDVSRCQFQRRRQQGQRKVVVNLPRTKYQKPYIPTLQGCRSSIGIFGEDSSHGINRYPLSLSHQHPFVGMVQLYRDHVNQDNITPHPPLLIGLDIVVFEEYNPKMYENQDEFLNVFRDDYFTRREWNIIMGGETRRNEEEEDEDRKRQHLQEFYIRWSMKEAYTKALGLGLGMDYSVLDITLQIDRDDYDYDERGGQQRRPGVSTMLKNGRPWFYQSGFVEYHANGVSEEQQDEQQQQQQQQQASMGRKGEWWDFAFLSLKEKPDGEIKGCACVCVGPQDQEPKLSSTSSSHSTLFLPSYSLSIEWKTLQSLMQWHHHHHHHHEG